MIRPDDDPSIALCSRALRLGRITADYTPPAVADLIDALAQQRRDMRAELDELQRIYMTPATQALLRTEYARGFRDAQEQLARRCPDEEALIYSFSPSFVAASESGRFAG